MYKSGGIRCGNFSGWLVHEGYEDKGRPIKIALLLCV